MKKGLRVFFALFTLLGAMNCFLLEPVLAVQEEAVCLSEDGCDCCFVCCSFNHQILQSAGVPFSPSMGVFDLIPLSSEIHLDTPASSILHPPLAR